MATKKSSTTKAKTKTTKKTTAAKTTTKASAATAPVASTVNVMRLRSLHIMSVGIFVLLAILAGMFMSHDSYQLTVGYLTEDILAANGTLASAVRVVYDVEIRWVLVGILVLSAIVPLLYLTRWEQSYNEAVTKRRTVPWRWIDFGVTAALMVQTVALLSGVQDIMVLKLIGGLVAISLWLAWVAEKQNDGVVRPVWTTYAVGVVAGALPWLLIVSSAVATVVYGAVWSPWYVYALYAITVAGAVSLACIQFTNYRRKLTAWQQNYLIVERNYLAVNMLTKVLFAAVLIAGLLK